MPLMALAGGLAGCRTVSGAHDQFCHRRIPARVFRQGGREPVHVTVEQAERGSDKDRVMNFRIGRAGLAGRRDVRRAHILPAPLHRGRDPEQGAELLRDRSTGRIGANLIDQRHSFRKLSGGERGV
jgi:hypothetical protein